jgi:hypothetical protein
MLIAGDSATGAEHVGLTPGGTSLQRKAKFTSLNPATEPEAIDKLIVLDCQR